MQMSDYGHVVASVSFVILCQSLCICVYYTNISSTKVNVKFTVHRNTVYVKSESVKLLNVL